MKDNPRAKVRSPSISGGNMQVANSRWQTARPISDVGPLIAAILPLCSLLFALCSSVQAQPAKMFRIGYLNASSAAGSVHHVDALKRGLRELGYEEGKNIVIEYRYADGKPERPAIFAAELVRLNVDLIYTSGPADTKAAKAATTTIPIVMAWSTDPVAIGFVASLARPGGNITGSSTLTPELSGKQLELLKEVVPKLTRVAVIGTATEPGNAHMLKEIELAAGALKVKPRFLNITSPKDIEPAFRTAVNQSAHAGMVLPSPISNAQRKEFAQLAIKNRLPMAYWRSEFVVDGGLMSYATNFTELHYRAATYVDKILKGAKPADIPVEQPKKIEFVVNLQAAKKLGLTIPPQALARADKVIR